MIIVGNDRITFYGPKTKNGKKEKVLEVMAKDDVEDFKEKAKKLKAEIPKVTKVKSKKKK